MKVRWIGEPRALADPQIDVAKGDEVDVDQRTAKSLVDQGLAVKVATTAKKTAKKAAAPVEPNDDTPTEAATTEENN